MDRKEIERIAQEAGAQARGEKLSAHPANKAKLQKGLNTVFMALAAVGLILFFSVGHITGWIVIVIAMLIKIAEYFIRFLL